MIECDALILACITASFKLTEVHAKEEYGLETSEEADDESVEVEVDALMRGAADKAAVLDKIQGAAWAHFACHGDMDAKSLVLTLACPQDHAMQSLTSSSSWMCDVCKKDVTRNPRLRCDACDYDMCAVCVRRQRARRADLSMKEVQRRVRMRAGSTVVLSACNTGRGKITAEGVIGLARAFLFACVAAIVVSLWSVSAASRHAAPCAHHTSHMRELACLRLTVACGCYAWCGVSVHPMHSRDTGLMLGS